MLSPWQLAYVLDVVKEGKLAHVAAARSAAVVTTQTQAQRCVAL